MKVRFAVTPPAGALLGDALDAYLASCEELGFDTIWLSDVPLGPLGDPMVTLAYAAARTTTLKLGMNIVPLGRNPLWIAKQLAQVDALSRGRVLLSFVPGLGQPQERAALGHATGDRGRAIDDLLPLLRAWWAGETVTAEVGPWRYDDVALLPRPVQSPLEIWLGGIGPAALDRVARLADGWLTANATPDEAADGRRTIEERAAALGRTVDPEHFGISLAYAPAEPDPTTLAALRARRADGDLDRIVPIGGAALRALVTEHIDGGLTKFVLRPIGSGASGSWRAELEWLAEQVLPLQR